MNFRIHLGRGKEAWRKIQTVLLWISTLVIVILIQLGNWLVFIIFLGILGFSMISLVAYQQFLYKEKALEHAGKKVITGWIDEEEDLGEEYEFPIEEMTPFYALSEEDKEAVKKLIGDNKEKLKRMDKKAYEIYLDAEDDTLERTAKELKDLVIKKAELENKLEDLKHKELEYKKNNESEKYVSEEETNEE